MTGHELPMKSGDEYDALTRWRRFLHWRTGVRTWVKRKYHERVRRVAKQQLKIGED